MTTYINANEFYDYIDFYRKEFDYTSPMTIKDFLECINLYKSEHGISDIQKIKHGRWEGTVDVSFLFDENKFFESLDEILNYRTTHTEAECLEHFAPYTCSSCGAKRYFKEPYCFNCGAIMDKRGTL